MTTIVHCYEHDRGYFDFMTSTIRLGEIFPDYVITWAVPSRRCISEVLDSPNTELFRVPDCSFLALIRDGTEKNEAAFKRFCQRINTLSLSRDRVFVDFRYGFTCRVDERLRDMVKFKPELTAAARSKIAETVGEQYEVVHCRVGDAEMCEGQRVHLDKYIVSLENYVSQTQLPVLLLSDSVSLKTRMSGSVKVTTGTPFHSGLHQSGDLSGFVLDVTAIQNAVKVHAITSLPWGNTSFSRVPALYAGVPFTVEQI